MVNRLKNEYDDYRARRLLLVMGDIVQKQQQGDQNRYDGDVGGVGFRPHFVPLLLEVPLHLLDCFRA